MTLEKLPFVPEKSSYVYKTGKEVISEQLDGGLSRRRKDVAEAASIVECTWFLNPVDYQYFTAFYQFATVRGSRPFLVDLILDQPLLEERQAAFTENGFDVNQIGLDFEVKTQLEVVSNQDNGFAEMVLILYGQDGYLNELEELVNIDLEIANG